MFTIYSVLKIFDNNTQGSWFFFSAGHTAGAAHRLPFAHNKAQTAQLRTGIFIRWPFAPGVGRDSFAGRPAGRQGGLARKHQTLDVPAIIRKKYKNFFFLGAIIHGKILNSLDFELYTTLDHSIYNQLINTINYNPFINVITRAQWDFKNQISRPVTFRLIGVLTRQF